MPELREQLSKGLGDRYVIEREIGAGGMATVYLARDRKHDRHVALKVLDPDLAAVMGVERFLAEIRVTAHLQHPNILPLFDSGETSTGSLFYVMPYVEGESLRRRIEREKQLPVEEAIRITAAIAGALDYAHRHHVIHRDLKPENILFHEGQPVVADFGIALAVSHAGGHRITQTGLSLGTPAYMSPEQATGDRAIDGRTDVYSLGAMLYEMLTGEPPHTGSTAQAIIARVLTEKPRRVRAVRPAVPAHVEAALERALEKLPADRWTTAGEFCGALAGRTIALLPSPAAPGLSPVRSLVAPVPLGLGVVALAAMTLAVVAWRGAARAANGPTIRFTIPFGGADRPYLSPAGAISPDGERIVYPGYSAAGDPMLFLRRVNELAPQPLVGTEQGLQSSFSPDGRSLAFFALGALKRLDFVTGTVRTLTSINLPQGIDWATDGEIIVSADDRLVSVAASGGPARPLTALDTAHGEESQRGPHVISNGKWVLFFSWRGSFETSKIGVVSRETGAASYLDISGSPVGVVDGQLIYVDRNEGLFAIPFDERRGRLTGSPVRLPDVVPVVGNGLGRAAVSRSGSLMYASGSSTSQLVRVDDQGRAEVVLSEPKPYSLPRFSPDGKRIAVSVGSASSIDVWIYDIASKTSTRLTRDGSRNDRVEWTPDSKRVIYSTVGRKDLTALWMQSVDLSDAPHLLAGSRSEPVLEGIVTPDGSTLVFRSTSREHPHDIWYRKLTGDTSRKEVVRLPSTEYGPRLSPDGKWIAYSSNQDGKTDVYVQPFPPTGAVIKVSDSGGATPVWSPDGRRLYYLNAAKIYAATVRTTPSFAVLGRDLVLAGDGYSLTAPIHAPFDVAPDGKHFLLVRPSRADDGLVVVHNWKRELRELIRATADRR